MIAPRPAAPPPPADAAAKPARWSVEEVEPSAVREELVDFFWEQRHWPYPTREDYDRVWEWRYASLGDAPARIWIARSQLHGEVLGHIAVYPRRFRFHGRDLLAAVPGNFVVRADHRSSLIGPRLAAGLRRLVAGGEFDLVLAYGNPTAHQMFSRLGFRSLGRLHEYVDIRKSATLLRRRSRATVAVAPLVDASLATRRWWRNRGRQSPVRELHARELRPDEVTTLDRSHWSEPQEQIVGAATGKYLAGRYLAAPFSGYRVLGVFDPSNAVQALVAMSVRRRVKILECVANADALDIPAAIDAAIRILPHAHAVLVPILPGSRVASELAQAGYFGREPRDPVAARSWWSAYWQQDHPLASELSKIERWALFFGATHY